MEVRTVNIQEAKTYLSPLPESMLAAFEGR